MVAAVGARCFSSEETSLEALAAAVGSCDLVYEATGASKIAFEAMKMERWPSAVRALISGRHPPDAYRDLLTGPSQGIKNVLAFA